MSNGQVFNSGKTTTIISILNKSQTRGKRRKGILTVHNVHKVVPKCLGLRVGKVLVDGAGNERRLVALLTSSVCNEQLLKRSELLIHVRDYSCLNCSLVSQCWRLVPVSSLEG